MTIVNTQRTFGVELEFVNTQFSLAELTTALNSALKQEFPEQACKFLTWGQSNQNTKSYWKMTTDGSLQQSGGELISPPLPATPESFRQIEIVTRVLNNMNSKVDINCGLHVHHDANDLTVRQVGHIYGLYASFQTLISSSLAPSRRVNAQYMSPENYNNLPENNKNAKAWNTPRFKQVRHWANTPALQDLCDMTNKSNEQYARYNSTVNLQSLAKHGTIEFRQHQGTLNADKIISWVLVTQAFIERFVQHKMTWISPNPDYKTGQWRMFLRALNVAHSYTKLHPDAQVYTDAFNFMKANIRKFARTAR
tara:strand:- start:15 stop:941 length:927 start_codon:yes stop_codon:yes gene_type:complete